MDKGKRRFNQDRKPGRPAKQVRPEFKRDREDDAFAEQGSTDKLEGRNAVTEALRLRHFCPRAYPWNPAQ